MWNIIFFERRKTESVFLGMPQPIVFFGRHSSQSRETETEAEKEAEREMYQERERERNRGRET